MGRKDKDGDFDRIYRGAYPRVYRTLAAILTDPADVADCTQEAFLRAYQDWERWRSNTSPELAVMRFAIDRAIVFRGKEQARRVRALLDKMGQPATNHQETDLSTQHDIVAALRKLHPRFAAPIVLRYYHGYSNREISQVLGVSERTIVNRIRQGSERLKAAYEASYPVRQMALTAGGLHAGD